MSVRKSCDNCKYSNHEKCNNFYLCGENKEYWELADDEKADVLHDAVPVVTEQAEPEQNAAYWMNKVLESAHEAWENLHDTADFKKAIEQAEEIKKQLGIAEHDAVNHPSHYTAGGIECIDALKAATTGLQGIEAVCTANAIKYLWRWKDKNGAEDIRKAIWYCERLLKEIGDERTE